MADDKTAGGITSAILLAAGAILGALTKYLSDRGKNRQDATGGFIDDQATLIKELREGKTRLEDRFDKLSEDFKATWQENAKLSGKVELIESRAEEREKRIIHLEAEVARLGGVDEKFSLVQHDLEECRRELKDARHVIVRKDEEIERLNTANAALGRSNDLLMFKARHDNPKSPPTTEEKRIAAQEALERPI